MNGERQQTGGDEPPAGSAGDAASPLPGEQSEPPAVLGETQSADSGAAPAPTLPPTSAPVPTRVYAYSGLISAFVLLFGAAMFFAGWGAHALVTGEEQSPAQAVQAAAATPTPTVRPTLGQQTPPAIVDVSADDDPAWGPADAKVTVIEFSDFQCPYCRRFHDETLPQLRQMYGDRIRFVYRDLPLTSLHAFAQGAAEAAECADEQGKFWEYHDLLFQNQTALQPADLKAYAARLGLNQSAFDACVDSHKYADEVNADVQAASDAAITGTPTFFINGRRLVGAQPLSAFQQAIDAALQQAQ